MREVNLHVRKRKKETANIKLGGSRPNEVTLDRGIGITKHEELLQETYLNQVQRRQASLTSR